MTRVLLVARLAALAAGCGSAFDGGSSPPASGSLQWKLNTLNQYAYSHCYTYAKRAATAQPFGSGPPIYPLSRVRPLVAVGQLKPHGSDQTKAVLDGCANGMVEAFEDVLSLHTSVICKMQRAYVDPDMAACEGVS